MRSLHPILAAAMAILVSMLGSCITSASALLVGHRRSSLSSLSWRIAARQVNADRPLHLDDVNAASLVPRGSFSCDSSRGTTRRRSNNGSSTDVDGQGRGKYIMAFVLFLCIWIFSIPPDFRRAHICASSNPSIVRSDCVGLGEWIQQVGDYYQGGGGVHFDFSIDQSTKDFWAGK